MFPNVVVIQVNGVSRQQAQRYLRSTISYLNSFRTNSTEEFVSHKAFDFSSFNTVGFNSIPNQIAFLSGCLAHDLTGLF